MRDDATRERTDKRRLWQDTKGGGTRSGKDAKRKGQHFNNRRRKGGMSVVKMRKLSEQTGRGKRV